METISRLREIIVQIRSSSHKYNKFKSICEGTKSKKKTVPLDNATRWSSTFKMIHTALILKYEIITWCSEEEVNIDLLLSHEHWSQLKFIKKSLEKFSELTTYLQGQNYPTIHSTIPVFNILFDTLDDMHEEYPNFKGYKLAFNKLKKYYALSDDCPAHFIGTILNPNEKMNYFVKKQFENEEQKQIKKLLEF